MNNPFKEPNHQPTQICLYEPILEKLFSLRRKISAIKYTNGKVTRKEEAELKKEMKDFIRLQWKNYKKDEY